MVHITIRTSLLKDPTSWMDDTIFPPTKVTLLFPNFIFPVSDTILINLIILSLWHTKKVLYKFFSVLSPDNKHTHKQNYIPESGEITFSLETPEKWTDFEREKNNNLKILKTFSFFIKIKFPSYFSVYVIRVKTLKSLPVYIGVCRVFDCQIVFFSSLTTCDIHTTALKTFYFR